MIEGIHVDVPAAELKELLLGRLKYHQDKESLLRKQLVNYDEANKGIEEEAERISKAGTNSHRESIQSTIKRHHDQSIFYRFVAEHVVPSEVYRLGEDDLVRLGIKADRYS